ncbi:aprataxin-like [Thraustotheca clavata]|uniref:Aprataxin-like n=1 Tax=Thraustotheca clavata TaxID=74557 RepID=A0A1W0A6Z7_9STRA|nr:aprataxin-like [Thraustotheca clavata]
MSLWKDALLVYLKAPETHSEVFFHDDQVVAVLDKYPKAQFHAIVIPRQELSIAVGQLTKQHLPLLQHIASIIPKIIDDRSNIRVGFHAIPSMRQLHVHVISNDMKSPSLKKKQHWNSFTTSFFKPLSSVIEMLNEEGHVPINEDEEKAKLTRKLACHLCGVEFNQLPKLKLHLDTEHSNKRKANDSSPGEKRQKNESN